MKKILKWMTVSMIMYSALYGAKVYLVLGSDTAIWDGMDTHNINSYYNYSLYTSPERNGAKVMDSAWRNGLRDSYGNEVCFTWGMMAGNIFRYAPNLTVPVPKYYDTVPDEKILPAGN